MAAATAPKTKKPTSPRKRKPSKVKAKAAATPPVPQTSAQRAIETVERLAKVQVGIVLEARDALTAAAGDLRADYASGEAAEKQLKRFERRGNKATKAAERRVKKTRTRVERELKSRRREAEKRVKAERRRVEREARDAAARVDEVREAIRKIDLANSAGSVQTQVVQAVQTGVETGTQVVRRASERITNAA